MTKRLNGEMKFFNDPKGYGFIKRDEGGKDVFVHITSLHASGLEVVDVPKGTLVSFETEDGGRGVMQAVNIELRESNGKVGRRLDKKKRSTRGRSKKQKPRHKKGAKSKIKAYKQGQHVTGPILHFNKKGKWGAHGGRRP